MDSRADVQDEVLKLINIDILYRTFEKTLLSPVFAIWVPVMAIAVGGGGSGGWLYGATIYFVVVLLRWMVLFSSRVWRNGWAGTKGRGEIDWDEEVVVVTGGSSGLGRVLVETLRHKFVRVAVLDVVEMGNVNEEYGAWLLALNLSLVPDSVRFFRCDVGDPAQLELTARQIVDTLGQPTILVHNAACAHGHSILDLTPALFHKTFATNVFSHFYSLSLFLPHIISRKSGHIVTIASVLGTSSVPQLADYCASKAAAISLHHTLRCELDSRYNCPLVRTTLVCPGRLETKMFSTIKPQNPFFFPVVSPHEVVKLIIQALDSHESRDIFIPLYTRYTWLLKICPTWLEDAVRYLAGVNDSMITFKKVEE